MKPPTLAQLRAGKAPIIPPMPNTNAQHTPGPWATSRDAVPAGIVQITVYAESDGERVATVFQAHANARLIAAAPDLLAACTLALKCADDHGGDHFGYGEYADTLRAALAATQ